ncbi:hypothetical protein M9Y10_011072 [Tritrichomonas musculus]|uniref:Myb-like DNA-binding domain containing protein n=1 Tax=Tritrichomonas musculus TaxID=1915356 RepID=A0ABR2IPA4_9EUKA
MIPIPSFIIGSSIIQSVDTKKQTNFSIPIIISTPLLNICPLSYQLLCMSNPIQNNDNNSHQKCLNTNSTNRTPKIEKKGDSLKQSPNKKSRNRFTREEDEKIKKLVNIFGTQSWILISKFMLGRSPKQIRDRYSNYLIPGLFLGEWSKEEDELLIKLFDQYGPKWSIIQNFFPNRGNNSIKNRWHNILNKKLSKENEKKLASISTDDDITNNNDSKNESNDESIKNDNVSFDINEIDILENINFEEWEN